ncbi:hypothetical protein EDB89DRAFT_1911224 [Lactarius sanguifluus]|nr:hypothetical protein EDB89DRAFT_1911224 [Lactarius sanguifluus]
MSDDQQAGQVQKVIQVQGEVPQVQWSKWRWRGRGRDVARGRRVAVVSGRVDSCSLARAAGWHGGGAARRVAGLRSRDWASLAGLTAGWQLRGFARSVRLCCSDVVVKWRWRVGVAMSERRKKNKKESLNEVGSRAGGVGGDVRAYESRWGCRCEPWLKPRELVVWGLACRDGMASGRGFRVAGYWWWWWWMSRETGPRAYVWRGGGVAAAVTWRKPSSSSSAGVLRVATAWRRGGLSRGGVLMVEVDGDGAMG